MYYFELKLAPPFWLFVFSHRVSDKCDECRYDEHNEGSYEVYEWRGEMWMYIESVGHYKYKDV